MVDGSATAGFTDPTLPTPAVAPDPNVPAKFIGADGTVDVGSMAVRLAQLESKMGAESAPAPMTPAPLAPVIEPTTQTTVGGNLTLEEITPYIHEWTNTGALTEASYAALEARGISRNLTTEVMTSQKTKLDSYYEQVASAAGGRTQYNQLAEWANSNLSADEAAYFQKEIHSGNEAAATAAVKSLAARSQQAAAGPLNGFLMGEPVGAQGVAPFKNVHEKDAALRVPSPTHPGKLRVNTDPAYRRDVEQRSMAFYSQNA